MLSQELLDILWDFRDPESSEERFRRAILSGKYDDVEQVELATQLARALGLQGRFDEAKAVLSEVADSEEVQEPVVRARLLLERGRILNSSGHPALSMSVLENAATVAEAAGQFFLAIDAYHMLAIVDPAHGDRWTDMALELAGAAEDPRTRRWAIGLHNDWGWNLHESGDYWSALYQFRLAKIRADEAGTDEEQRAAGWTVARCLRSTGRYADALEIQQELAAENADDQYVQDEITKLRALMEDVTAKAERTEQA